MLELLMNCTDEKNISLAVKGYKIFFSSTSLTLKCKLMTGLKIKRKPVAGLTTKNCQPFSGRDMRNVMPNFRTTHKPKTT